MNIDTTTLQPLGQIIEPCEVISIPAGSTPKAILVELPGVDGARVLAQWTGHPALVVGNFVSIQRHMMGALQYVVFGTSAGTASLPATHSLLSASHPDTSAAGPAAGDLLIANATPLWTKLAIGTAGFFLKVASGLPSWAALADADIPATIARDSEVREKLAANRTYYVRTDGSDSNTGLIDSAGGAFLTIQKAVDVVAGLDLAIYDALISVADGAYNATVTLKNLVGAGTCTIRGNVATPANVTITVTGSGQNCIEAYQQSGKYILEGFKLVTTTGVGILGDNGAIISYGSMDLGACGYHILMNAQATALNHASYSITGGANAHIFLLAGGQYIQAAATTCTVTGTPAFGQAFAIARQVSVGAFAGVTYSGAATGTRYDVNKNAVLDTNGGGATFFPGDAAGSAATGGQYT